MEIEENRFDHVLYEIKMYFFSYVYRPHSQFEVNLKVECRAIHLRNLVCFFKWKRHRNGYWHVSDFVSETERIRLIENAELFNEVWDRASVATGHLVEDYRLTHAYKVETLEWYERAFPAIVEAVSDFLNEMDEIVVPERKADWEDDRIKNRVVEIRKLMEVAGDPLLHNPIKSARLANVSS